LPPADLIAGLISALLLLALVVLGIGAGYLAFQWFLPVNASRTRWWVVLLISIAIGLYATMVTSTAYSRLPHAIFVSMKDD
jgi:hypothetical protein